MTLIVMSGLPASGKSTVARRLAADLGCAVIPIDTIERGLHDAGVAPSQPIGLAAYAVANRLVEVQLSLGHTVIADAVNHHPDARRAWLDLAAAHGVELRVVPWQRVVELRDTWTPWPVATETVDTAPTASGQPAV